MLGHNLKDIIIQLKTSNSVYVFCKSTLNLPVRFQGDVICAPAFIRDNDIHPSFQINDTFAYDHGTHKFYDIIDIAKLALFSDDPQGFKDAVEYLAGYPVFTQQNNSSSYSSTLSAQQKTLNDNVAFWHSTLLSTPEAMNYLHSRHITDETIKAFSLGYSPKRHRVIFPYTKNNQFTYFCGRDDSPFTREGLPPRYDLPKNDPDYAPKYKKASLSDNFVHENIAWGGQTLRPGTTTKQNYLGSDGREYSDTTPNPRDKYLCILEGLVDALSFAQDGWQVQSPGGGHFSKSYLPHLLDLARMYDKVLLCFDNDNAGHNFLLTMSRILADAHIPFMCAHVPQTVTTPEGHNIGVKDVSDYYCAGGSLEDLVKSARLGILELADAAKNENELAEVFRQASSWCSAVDLFMLKEGCMLLEDKSEALKGFAVMRYSKKLINMLYAQAQKPIPEPDVAKLVEAKHNLLFDVAGKFYEYQKGVWSEVSDWIVNKYCGEALASKASAGRMKKVTEYLKIMHSGEIAFNKKAVISFLNGTLYLDELDPAKRFQAHNPADMTTTQLPYNYNPKATAPKWEKFIRDVCNRDVGKMRLLQQLAGYIMFPDNRLQKMFYLIGDGRNGKSVFMNVLEQLYGPENTSSVQPSKLSEAFDPIALQNSWVNFCYETKNAFSGNEDVLKAVVSGDPIMAAHKGVDAVKFRTRSKMIVAMNRFSGTTDVSYGLLRRLVFVHFDQTFIGDKDNKNLYSELITELPGIFNWAYEGYLALRESGEFTDALDSFETYSKFMEQMNPTVSFVNEELLGQYGRSMSEKEVYALYKEWCKQGGFTQLNRLEFMKDIEQTLRQHSSIGGIKIRRATDGRYRIFEFDDPEQTEFEKVCEVLSETADISQKTEKGQVIALGTSPDGNNAANANSSTQARETAKANISELPVNATSTAGISGIHEDIEIGGTTASGQSSLADKGIHGGRVPELTAGVSNDEDTETGSALDINTGTERVQALSTIEPPQGKNNLPSLSVVTGNTPSLILDIVNNGIPVEDFSSQASAEGGNSFSAIDSPQIKVIQPTGNISADVPPTKQTVKELLSKYRIATTTELKNFTFEEWSELNEYVERHSQVFSPLELEHYRRNYQDMMNDLREQIAEKYLEGDRSREVLARMSAIYQCSIQDEEQAMRMKSVVWIALVNYFKDTPSLQNESEAEQFRKVSAKYDIRQMSGKDLLRVYKYKPRELACFRYEELVRLHKYLLQHPEEFDAQEWEIFHDYLAQHPEEFKGINVEMLEEVFDWNNKEEKDGK